MILDSIFYKYDCKNNINSIDPINFESKSLYPLSKNKIIDLVKSNECYNKFLEIWDFLSIENFNNNNEFKQIISLETGKSEQACENEIKNSILYIDSIVNHGDTLVKSQHLSSQLFKKVLLYF